MKALILAAGYATRLYPLTKDRAKPLLPVAGRPIVDYLVDAIAAIPSIDRVYLVTNHRFAVSFRDWACARTAPVPIAVLDDGTTSNESRLGAVGDIRFVLQQTGLDDDLLVMAGDNLFDFGLSGFAAAFRSRREADAAVTVVKETDPEKLRRTGVAELTADGWIARFEEKPKAPRSHWAVPPLYLFRKSVLRLVDSFLESAPGADAPGHFIAWLAERRRVLAYPVDGRRYDIGTPQSYEEVQSVFRNK